MVLAARAGCGAIGAQVGAIRVGVACGRRRGRRAALVPMAPATLCPYAGVYAAWQVRLALAAATAAPALLVTSAAGYSMPPTDDQSRCRSPSPVRAVRRAVAAAVNAATGRGDVRAVRLR